MASSKDESALAGLRVGHTLQEGIKLAYYLVGMHDPLPVVRIAHQALVGKAGGEK